MTNAIETLAVKVMGWKRERVEWAKKDCWAQGLEHSIFVDDWDPHTNAADSKQLRDRLAERCDSTVLEWNRETGTFFYTMYPIGCAIKTWEGEGATEEAAVVNCALKLAGEDE